MDEAGGGRLFREAWAERWNVPPAYFAETLDRSACKAFAGRTPTPAAAPIRLSDLPVGTVARFHEARLDGDVPGFLRAIGLTDKAEFRLCKAGDPWSTRRA